MSKLRTTTLEPEGATTTLTLGGSGDSVVIESDAVKANTMKDAGGNTLWTSNGSGTLSSLNSALAGGGLTLLETQTVTSSVTSVDFTSTYITTDYNDYWIIGYGVYPAAGTQPVLKMQCGSGFNTQWSSTYVRQKNNDANSSASLDINTGAMNWDQTTLSHLSGTNGVDSGGLYNFNFILEIMDPASTGTWKSSLATAVATGSDYNNGVIQSWKHDRWQTTGAITDWRFKFDGQDIGGGTFKIYGVN